MKMIESFKNAMSEWAKHTNIKDKSTFEKEREAYEKQQLFGESIGTMKAMSNVMKGINEDKDPRYNDPKGKPKATKEEIDAVIESTEIYKQAKEYILNAAQPEQVGYGIDKYPEPLNADTWTIIETIDHIISESVDKLHYLVMLRIKLLETMDEDPNPNKIYSTKQLRETMEAMRLGPTPGTEKLKSVNDIRREHGLPPFDKECPEESIKLYGDGEYYELHGQLLKTIKEPEKITDCQIKIGDEFYGAKFIEVFQYSDVLGPSPMLGGHIGGIVAYPVAVVRHGATLKQVRLSDIIFDDVVI